MVRPKSVRMMGKAALIDTFQYHANNLLQQLIIERRNAQWTFFLGIILLLDICPAGRVGMIAMVFEGRNQAFNTFRTHAVDGFAVAPFRHVAFLRINILVCEVIHFRVIQVAIKSLEGIFFVTRFQFQTFQYVLWISHARSMCPPTLMTRMVWA